MAIAEITEIPFYDLYDKNLDHANYMNQVMFSHLISSLHRDSVQDNTSFELLFQSVPVNNQTYKAQVRFCFIIRKIGSDKNENEKMVSDTFDSVCMKLRENNFVINEFDDFDEYRELESSLEKAKCSKVYSISKKEKAIANNYSVNGYMYYNQVLEPAENLNTTSLINALTQYPESVVSLQIIPTNYSYQEQYCIEENKNFLNHYVSQVRFRYGLNLDQATQMVVDAYDYYSESENEPLFLYNFLVYSDGKGVADLSSRLMDAIETEEKTAESALTIVDVSDFKLSPSNNMFSSPWIINNILISKARDDRFWNNKNAPVYFKRFKQLMTTKEIRSVFKLPVDDEKLIGIESKKVLSNRERLDKNVISDGNFKIGTIQNTSISGKGAVTHAGIALNDFTKHGLIVGMPGSGKTNFSLGLLLQFWKDFKVPFLAIEPTKNEYRSLIDDIPELQIFTPGKNTVSPYIINPFIPPKGVTVENFVPSLMSAFKAAFSMPNPLPDIFLAAINDCYNEYGWRKDSTSDDLCVQHFGLYEFIKVFKRKMQRMDYKGEVKTNMESAGVVRLISLIEQNSNIYDSVNTIPLEDLLCKPTVIELNAINNKEQKSLIMALLLIMICVYTKNNVAGDGKLKNVMLIDEAHVLLSGNTSKSDESADSQGSTIESLEDMIAEIRSYGTSIIIADQAPTKVGRNIVANTNIKVIFKLVEKENKDMISTAINMSESDCDLLGYLGVGEAILHYGKLYSPLHIKTYNVHDKAKIREVISDSEIAALETYWKDHKDLLIPHMECKYNCLCKTECDFKVRSNADFIASRLINTYLYDISEKASFVKFLVNIDKAIAETVEEYEDIVPDIRLSNCIKIKFLRKALLIKNFGITNKEYKVILEHRNFLKGGVMNV